MALIVGTNSWVTVAEADTYFSTRYGADLWATLTTANKESLLITAYNWINSIPGISVSATSTDSKVKQGQMELAWFIYKHQDDYEERRALYVSGVREFQVSKFEETLEKPDEIPSFILIYFDDFLTKLGGGFATMSRTFDQNC